MDSFNFNLVFWFDGSSMVVNIKSANKLSTFELFSINRLVGKFSINSPYIGCQGKFVFRVGSGGQWLNTSCIRATRPRFMDESRPSNHRITQEDDYKDVGVS